MAMADAILGRGGWMARYRELLERNDLVPMLYASRPIETENAQYTSGQIPINITSSFWLFGLRGSAVNKVGDDPDFFVTEGFPSLDVRIRVDNDYPWGSWSDIQTLQGRLFNQWGPGFVIDRNSNVLIEWRRPFPLTAEIDSQQHQFVLYGCNLEPLGAARYGDNWRNLSREDWQNVAELQPVVYCEDIDEAMSSGANQWGEITLRISNRDFVCDRIQVYAMDGQGEDSDGNPTFPAPWLTNIFLASGSTMHNADTPGVASALWGGLSRFAAEWKFRIPRLIRANEILRVQVGGNPWAYAGAYADTPIHPRIFLQGYSIVGDKRRK